jgi:hypothetical protein
MWQNNITADLKVGFEGMSYIEIARGTKNVF